MKGVFVGGGHDASGRVAGDGMGGGGGGLMPPELTVPVTSAILGCELID